MTESNLDSLVFDLVEWVGKEPRTYRQVMDAWRTSCPRLTVWEEALERGYLTRRGEQVSVSEAGYQFLERTLCRSQELRPVSERSSLPSVVFQKR